MKIGFLHSRVRKDEKLLLEELRRRHNVEKIDTRNLSLTLEETGVEELDVAVNRAISQARGLYTTRYLESYGVPVVNDYGTSRVCMNKIETSLTLHEAGVPTPDTRVAFTVESALETIEEIGYPVVLKPVVGSWARLLAKINDREAAEAVLEHKKQLGHYEHSIFYIQDYVDKPDRDLRTMVAGDKVIAAMYRESDDWITNAARGAETTDCEITPEIQSVALDAAEAVGGGVLGVDIMETSDGYTVHEVNHTLEYKALTDATGVDTASAFVDYVEEVTA